MRSQRRWLDVSSVPASSQYQSTWQARCTSTATRSVGSRLSEGAQLPAILGHVRRDVPKPRQPGFFWGWPAALLSGSQRAVDCVWAGRLRQEGENGFAVLGPAKRAATLKGKFKGKRKGNQAQQPGSRGCEREKTSDILRGPAEGVRRRGNPAEAGPGWGSRAGGPAVGGSGGGVSDAGEVRRRKWKKSKKLNSFF